MMKESHYESIDGCLAQHVFKQWVMSQTSTANRTNSWSYKRINKMFTNTSTFKFMRILELAANSLGLENAT